MLMRPPIDSLRIGERARAVTSVWHEHNQLRQLHEVACDLHQENEVIEVWLIYRHEKI